MQLIFIIKLHYTKKDVSFELREIIVKYELILLLIHLSCCNI